MTSRPEVTERLVGADCETDAMEEVRRLSETRTDIVADVFQQNKMLRLKRAENAQNAINKAARRLFRAAGRCFPDRIATIHGTGLPPMIPQGEE